MASTTRMAQQPAGFSLSVAFDGTGKSPIQTMARFVLGIHELAEQVGRGSNGKGADFILEVSSVSAQSQLAVVDVCGSNLPTVSSGGLVYLITRLAEQIGLEDGVTCQVATAADGTADG